MKALMTISSFFGALILALAGGIFSRQTTTTKHLSQAPIPATCSTLVFDLGGILVETDKSKAMWELGPNALFNYWRANGDVNNLKATFYNTLRNIVPDENSAHAVKDENGKALPTLMAAWLRGDKPNKEILDMVLEHVDANRDWFSSRAEQKVISNMAEMIFTPDRFVKTRKLVPHAVELIKECKELGFKVYVVSNWDRESITIMAKKHSNLFSLFDGMVISGEVHALKPDPIIFKHIIKHTPGDACVYFDDQPENIQAAQNLGLHGVLISASKDNSSIDLIKEQITKLSQAKAASEQPQYA